MLDKNTSKILLCSLCSLDERKIRNGEGGFNGFQDFKAWLRINKIPEIMNGK